VDDVRAQVEAAFDKTTMAEVLAGPSESVHLCETADAQKPKLRKR
jgi:hypothetical protein